MGEQDAPQTTERIQAHEESMKARIDGHTARSEERLKGAVRKTSEAIGKTADAIGRHTPEPVGRVVGDVAKRAQAALDDDGATR